MPMETGRNLDHTTERHQRGFKVPMETGSLWRQHITVVTYADMRTCIVIGPSEGKRTYLVGRWTDIVILLSD